MCIFFLLALSLPSLQSSHLSPKWSSKSFAHNTFLFSLEQAQLVYIEIVMLSSSVYNAAFVCGWCHPAEIFWALPHLPIFCLICNYLCFFQSRTLYVKNLNFKTSDESLKKYFSEQVKEGSILSAKVIIIRLSRNITTTIFLI